MVHTRKQWNERCARLAKEIQMAVDDMHMSADVKLTPETNDGEAELVITIPFGDRGEDAEAWRDLLVAAYTIAKIREV